MSRLVKWAAGTVAIAVIGLAGVTSFLEKIDPGNVGVVYSPSGLKKEVLPNGWHIVGFFDKVNEYPIRLRTVKADQLSLATSDGKNVTFDVSYTYHVDQSKVIEIFNEFGPVDLETLESGFIRSRLNDAGRRAVSKFTVLDLFGEKSGDASTQIKEALAKDIEKNGFMLNNLTLGTPHPDEKTQQAIDARVAANQELERKNTELEIAKKEAEKQKTQAQGEADANRERAKGQADANQMLQQTITPELIQMKQVEAQIALANNQNLPKVFGGGNLLNIPEQLLTPPVEQKK